MNPFCVVLSIIAFLCMVAWVMRAGEKSDEFDISTDYDYDVYLEKLKKIKKERK